MLNRNTFKKTRLSQAVFSVLAASSVCSPVLAQDQGEGPAVMEEVVVTGIRSSLQQSMDVKRDSAGVVDAISAEDIGKFPDTNLAESLQRVTGVSVDRQNGEGSRVTIRGFGADNNMVTLNGRQMPGGSAFGGSSGAGGSRAPNSRAFDFANLASESVSGVEVYKTSKANIATGGIGGTINILTARPLDRPGVQGSVGVKAVHDTTNRIGDDITPEVSGIFSWTDDSDTFGVSLSGSYQERHSGAAGASVNDWNIARWDADDLFNNLYSWTRQPVLNDAGQPVLNADGTPVREITAQIDGAPEDGQLYARPNDFRYAFSDRYRERINGLLTLQYQPIETVTLTADFVYAENDLTEHRGEQTFWFSNSNSVDRVQFDDSAVATPALYSEALSGKDMGFEQQYREQEDKLESVGFNVQWDATDTLRLSFDAHNSTMESLPTAPGNSGSVDISIGAPVGTSQSVRWNRDLPSADFTTNDRVPVRDANNAIIGYRGNNNGSFDVGDLGTQVVRFWYAGQTTEVTQLKLDGSFDFDNSRFDFGVESRAMESAQQQSERNITLGDWGVSNPTEIPNGLLEPFSLTDQFDDYDLSDATRLGVRGDPVELARWALRPEAEGGGGYDGTFGADLNFTTDNLIEEDILAVYFQAGFESEIAGMATSILTGFRYETTDVASTSHMRLPEYLEWQDNNDFLTVFEDQKTPNTITTDYDHLLPSLSLDVSIREDLIGRFAYSKTIARAGFANLAASVGNFGAVGSTLLGGMPTATASNPRLLPLESDNLDLSLEWYYDETSYASVGFFEKRVTNFIGTEQIDENHFEMQDVTAGPRVLAAAAALEARGFAVTDTSLFVMTAVMDNPTDFPGGADDYQNNEDFWVDVATDYDLAPNATDPLMIFRTATPVNNKEARIYGSELAVQHFFGDTGFGVQANYTIVRGDVGFNDLADPSEAQFALTGLSDTANLVGIYEGYGVQARVALNWRDSFLNETNRGNSRNPIYVEAFTTVDLNVAYQFNDELSVFIEGINVTGEDVRQYGRSENQLWYLEDLGARYQVGARYVF